MFWFKRNKIVLTAFYDNPDLMEMFPVVEANKRWPSYYDTLAPNYLKNNTVKPESAVDKQSTIRACYGINNFNSHGFILPLWSDHSFILYNNQIEGNAPWDNKLYYHGHKQSEGSLDLFHVFKLESPWEFRCNKDIKFMMTQNFFAVNSDMFSICPGITDFYNQSTTNIFLLINKQQSDKEILLKAGTPIAKFIPLTDDDVELRYEQVEDVKSVKIKPFKYYFLNGLTKMMRVKKQTKELRKGCPFHV